MSFLTRQLEDPVRLKRIKLGFIILLVAVVVAEVVSPLLFHRGEHHFSFESWPAWGSLYGLISCVAIIVLSKLVGKAWLMRSEDYYDD